MSDDLLRRLKANRTKVGAGEPHNSEGSSGDFTLRQTTEGVILYAKYVDKWYRVGRLKSVAGRGEGRIEGRHKVTTNEAIIKSAGSNMSITSNSINADKGDITIYPKGGNTILERSNLKIDGTQKLYFDGGGDTYIFHHSSDHVRFIVGGDIMFSITEAGDDGNTIDFESSSVGFTQLAESFSDDSIIGSSGTHDTHIDFRHSNKIKLDLTASMTNMNLIFPNMSGNFQLLLTYNGDWDITNWKAYEWDESAASGSADVLWAGGTKLATTNNGIDIVSFYWDNNNEKAYAVSSTGFATP